MGSAGHCRSSWLRTFVVMSLVGFSALFLPGVEAKSKSKSRADRLVRAKRTDCENSALCYSKPDHEKLLCAMRCVSEACYDQTYGPPAEELEEGEIDKSRENSYNRCVKAEARNWKNQ